MKEKLFEQILNEDYEASYNNYVKAVSPKGRTKKFDFDEVYSDIKSQFIRQ